MEEEQKTAGSKWVAIWPLVIALMIVGMIVYSNYQDQRYLRSHPVYTTGVVTGIFKAGRGEQYVSYTFVVDTATYKGQMPIRFCLECSGDCCAVGEKVKVRYAEGNPANNELVHQ